MGHDDRTSRGRFDRFLKVRRRDIGHDEETGDLTHEDRRLKRRGYVRAYIRWLRPFRGRIGLVFALAALATVGNLAKPIFIQQIVDHGILNESLDTAGKLARLHTLGLLMVGVILVIQSIEAVRMYRLAVVDAQVIFRLRQRLFDHMLQLPLGKLSETKQGGITSRLSGDIDSVTRMLQLGLISPGVALLQLLMAVCIILAWNWRLALATIVCVPPLVLIHLLVIRRIRPIYRSMRKDREEVDGRVVESFGGIRVVRSFRREAHERHDYAVGHHTVIRKTLLARWLETMVNAGWGVMMPGISVVIVWFGGYLMIRDAATGAANPTTIGQLFAFEWYAWFLFAPVLRIIDSMSQTQQALAALERVFDVLSEPEDKPDAPDAVAAPTAVDRVRFDRVGFEYELGRPVIEDFTLDVPGGSVVALVGPSGAGKTTITDLVARFHDPTRGSITLNGVDLRRFTLDSYRRLLGVVQQETFLFDGSVRDNIAYGRRNAGENEVRAAAVRANAAEFIDQLPSGYDTVIGERGVKLSGGQRQRLSIARAFLADPQILILDEATSNLDTESEQLIQSAMRELLKGRTTFVIAHRLSTITHADMIVVMDAGRIIELGRHEDLLTRDGLYAAMVRRQREAFGSANFIGAVHGENDK